jgi:hypothetical protein
MSECKHGLKSGCAYCHAPVREPGRSSAAPRRRSRTSTMSEKMNDRMTALKQRLRQLRGE